MSWHILGFRVTRQIMSEKTKQNSARRMPRRRGLQAAAAVVARTAGPILKKGGLSEARIVTDWHEIVGSVIASATSPDRLSRPPKSAPGSGVLHIRVSGPVATEIQHLTPQIIERVNGYFGYQAIDRIHLIHAPTHSRNAVRQQMNTARKNRRIKDVPAARLEEIETATANIQDDDLRVALRRLGTAIHKRTATRSP